MTTAIEQAKREMYAKFVSTPSCRARDEFESALELLLEQLRQQYEEMASTAHQRFESIQSLESVNQDLIDQLAKMTESRDMFRNLHQAATHASIDRVGRGSTSGQTSGDRASCEQPDANAAEILDRLYCQKKIFAELEERHYAAKALADEQKRAHEKRVYVMNGAVMAAALSVNNLLWSMWHAEAPKDTCMHSFFAIGDDEMKCTFCGVGK